MKQSFLPILIAAKKGTLSKGTLYFDISYTLQDSAKLSLGVYDGDNLVRLLVSAMQHDIGTYNIYWDGKDNNGEVAANGTYTILPITNNLQYTWEGAHIGNTSTASSGNGKHHVYGALADVAITNGKATYVTGYSEHLPSVFAFSTSAIQTKLDVFNVGASTPFTNRIATDGINNYYTGYNSFISGGKYRSFIYASKCSDNSKVEFSSGISYTMAPFGDAYSVAGYLETPTGTVDNYITSHTVCAANNLLYFARPSLNAIYCVDKNTGAAIATITSFTNPKSVAFDASGNLWVASGTNTIAKYTVNPSTGALTATGVTITGVTSPGKMMIDPTGNTLSVLDLATNQLKTFANSTGAAGSLIIGSTVSYSSNSVVADDKFNLTALVDTDAPTNKYVSGGFCFDPADNSIWIADIGTNRYQHFSSTGTFLASLQITTKPYGTRVDLADNTRVFGQLLEYSINYSQPLSGNSGWALTKNWGPQISATLYDTYLGFASVRTFTDGITNRTFAFLNRKDYVRGYELVELQSSGTIRFTGVIKDSPLMDANGAIFLGDGNTGSDGGAYAFNKHAFTGTFDGSNNPVWASTADIVFDISTMTGDDANIAQGIITQRNPFITSDNKVVIFNNSTAATPAFHIGFGNKYGTTFCARSARSTYPSYSGSYPGPEYNEAGNNIGNNAFMCVNVLGNVAMVSNHDENWRGGQVRKYKFYHSSGLPLGQYGTTRYDSPGEAPPMMDGNGLSPQMVAGETSDIAYIYDGGESDHSAVHRVKVTGLNSITVHPGIMITIPNAKLNPPALPGINLFEGAVHSESLSRNTNAWSGDADVSGETNFSAKWGSMNPDINTPDLRIDYRSLTQNKQLQRVLQPAPVTLTAWSITGKVAFPGGSYPNTGAFSGDVFLEVLDNTGKIIAQFYIGFSGADNVIMCNDLELHRIISGTNPSPSVYLQQFTISKAGNALTCSYMGNEPQSTTSVAETGADRSKPTTMRVRFLNGTVNAYGHAIDLDGLRFIGS